jgi:hypothetical protein
LCHTGALPGVHDDLGAAVAVRGVVQPGFDVVEADGAVVAGRPDLKLVDDNGRQAGGGGEAVAGFEVRDERDRGIVDEAEVDTDDIGEIVKTCGSGSLVTRRPRSGSR